MNDLDRIAEARRSPGRVEVEHDPAGVGASFGVGLGLGFVMAYVPLTWLSWIFFFEILKLSLR